MSKKFAQRSAQNILEEVLLHYDQGYSTFVIVDDIFNLKRETSDQFYQLIIKNNLKIRILFPSGLRGDILTPDQIDLMAEAGVIQFALALETASPRLQKLIRKNLKIDRLQENLHYTSQKYPHIILDLFAMFGFPSETEEEALMTLDFIKSIEWLHFPVLNALKIFPGTEMVNLAYEHGITREDLERNADKAYHEIADYIPFPLSFAKWYQSKFLQEYFLNPKRLKAVIKQQKKVLTYDEITDKYNSYLPGGLKSYPEITRLLDQEENGSDDYTLNVSSICHRPVKPVAVAGLRVLLLDLSQHFSDEADALYDVVEPPLGLMYLLTYANQVLGDKISGKILKSRIDFDDFDKLKAFLTEFQPEVIGIRTLAYHKHFFHKSIALIRSWGIDVPIITGGPYASSNYKTILSDNNIDICVVGEGELTFVELLEKILENGGRLPDDDVLSQIDGVAFIPRQLQSIIPVTRDGEDSVGNGRNLPKTPSPALAPVRDVILLDRLTNEVSLESYNDLDQIDEPKTAAHIIYTSGSTSKPKGVVVTHANVRRLFEATQNWYGFNDQDIWALSHAYASDLSVWEMWGALLYGGKLVIVPYDVTRSPLDFYKLLSTKHVTILNQTPSSFKQFIAAEENILTHTHPLSLRLIILGGEALHPTISKPWMARHGDTNPKLINMYGTTETTIYVTCYPLTMADTTDVNNSRIGRPLPDLSVYLLDQDLKPVPVGVSAELCVSGAGLSQGYLHLPRLTAEKFIPNPFSDVPGARLYKTGDLARYLPDKALEYVGRTDRQVNIREGLIELSEIETILEQHPAVQEAFALAREDEPGNKRLVAYFVPVNQTPPSAHELRIYMQAKLPSYKVPAAFVSIDTFPLTTSGKIDQLALPLPGITQSDFDKLTQILQKVEQLSESELKAMLSKRIRNE